MEEKITQEDFERKLEQYLAVRDRTPDPIIVSALEIASGTRAASVPSDKERADALKVFSGCFDPHDDWIAGCGILIKPHIETIKRALTAPDQSEYDAVCADLDRAHDHIKLYVEAGERNRETIKTLVEALDEADTILFTIYPDNKAVDDVRKKLKQALALAEKPPQASVDVEALKQELYDVFVKEVKNEGLIGCSKRGIFKVVEHLAATGRLK